MFTAIKYPHKVSFGNLSVPEATRLFRELSRSGVKFEDVTDQTERMGLLYEDEGRVDVAFDDPDAAVVYKLKYGDSHGYDTA